MGLESGPRDTAIGIFKLLRQFAEIRRRPVLDIQDYERHLWCHRIKTEPDSYNRLYHDGREIDPDVWIEIRRRVEPACPLPPAMCVPWLQSHPPFDDEEPPELRERVLMPVTDEEQPDESNRVASAEWRRLADHPDIIAQWDRYLEQAWLEWAQDHSEWRYHHQQYSSLFGMRQTLKRAGEQFELLLGVGLLETDRPDGKRVRRHVLTVRAALDFSLEDGAITVRAPLSGLPGCQA